MARAPLIGTAVRLFIVLACAWLHCALSSVVPGGRHALDVLQGKKQATFLDEQEAVRFRRLASTEGLPPVSTACSHGISEYLNCQIINAAFYTCSNRQILNDTAIQTLLRCSPADEPGVTPAQRLEICRVACLAKAGGVLHEPTSITGACNPSIQAMHSFSARLSLFEVGKIDEEHNFTDPILLPMPNVKGLGGVSVIDLGKPEKCAQISGAQYCLLSGELAAAGGMKITFSLGECLPTACSQAELQNITHTYAGKAAQALKLMLQCGMVEALGPASGISKQTEDVLGWGGIPVKYPFLQPMTGGFVATIIVTLLFFLLVCAGTFVEWRRESKERETSASHPSVAATSFVPGTGLETAQPLIMERPALPPMTQVEQFLNHWSALRNARSFLRTRPKDKNPFACMDCIRTLSMSQVILGHMYVYSLSSSGLSNMEQFNPPYGMMGQLWFMIVPGCFYGVDSFFMLSGFLCCYSLQKKVFNKPENRSPRGFLILYPKFIVLRVLRLLPLEMFCIALCVNVLPQVGTGILWNTERPDGAHCFDGAGGAGCDQYWWTNLLFLQNIDAYMGKCFAHTWYLANDMQLYLTAPLFSLAYSYDRRIGWGGILAGLCVGVASPMIIAANLGIVPDTLLGGTQYMSKIYMKPWCRCTPFFVGIAAAWLWLEKLEQFNFRHITMKGRAVSYSLSLFGVFLCLIATFGRIGFYQCDLVTCSNIETNPGGKFWLYTWAGFSTLGWSVGLAIIMVLCFQNRFLPVIQNFFHLSLWQPFAKLSYAAYLCHTCVLIMNYCQQTGPVNYNNPVFFFYYVSFVAVTMFAAFCLYIILEKPLANIQMMVFAAGGGDS